MAAAGRVDWSPPALRDLTRHAMYATVRSSSVIDANSKWFPGEKPLELLHLFRRKGMVDRLKFVVLVKA